MENLLEIYLFLQFFLENWLKRHGSRIAQRCCDTGTKRLGPSRPWRLKIAGKLVGKPHYPMVYVGLSSMGWDIPWDIKRKSMFFFHGIYHDIIMVFSVEIAHFRVISWYIPLSDWLKYPVLGRSCACEKTRCGAGQRYLVVVKAGWSHIATM